MKFFRAAFRPDTGELVGVVEQATPFESAGRMLVDGRDLEMVDLGAAETAEGHAWTDLVGATVNPARHVHARLEQRGVRKGHDVTAEHCGVAVLHDCPCTHEGLQKHVRAKGRGAIPEPVKAWLSVALSPAHPLHEHLGSVTLAQRRAAEVLRLQKDPHGHGERLTHLSRQAAARRELIKGPPVVDDSQTED